MCNPGLNAMCAICVRATVDHEKGSSMPALILPDARLLDAHDMQPGFEEGALQRSDAPRLEQAVELGIMLFDFGWIE